MPRQAHFFGKLALYKTKLVGPMGGPVLGMVGGGQRVGYWREQMKDSIQMEYRKSCVLSVGTSHKGSSSTVYGGVRGSG